MEFFPEIKELNTILLSNQNQLEWMNNPDSILLKISDTKNIIQKLKKNLNLTQIESHDSVWFQNDVQKLGSGLAYYFGDKTSQTESYIVLVFGEDKNTLNKFKYYEQFSDCSIQENINYLWEFITITPDCNN